MNEVFTYNFQAFDRISIALITAIISLNQINKETTLLGISAIKNGKGKYFIFRVNLQGIKC